MATKVAPSLDKTADTDRTRDRGYVGWKRIKIEQALVQADDRDTMIPAEKVWRDLGLEG